jgi:hypothetical protein
MSFLRRLFGSNKSVPANTVEVPSIDRLVKASLAPGTDSLSWEVACERLRDPRNKAAIPIILRRALTSRDREAVEKALRALKAIGTAETTAALETFCQRWSRLLYDYKGYIENPPQRYSSDLGQTPCPEELRQILQALRNDIRYGTREDALNAVRALLTDPGRGGVATLSHLENVLNAFCYKPLNRLVVASTHFTLPAVKRIAQSAMADAPARKAAIRDLITSSDVSILRAFLSEGDEWRRTTYKTLWLLVS